MQTTAKAYCSLLHQLPATMAERDRPVLCAWLEADIAPRPRSVLQSTMAKPARMASALELFEFQRPYALAETETEDKKRKGQKDAQARASSYDAPGTSDDTSDDDASHECSGLHWPSIFNASHVPAANHAVPNATDGASTTYAAAATSTAEHCEDAGAHASTSIHNARRICDASNACTAHAEDGYVIGSLQQHHGCRGTRTDVYDPWTTSRAPGRHATEGPEGSDQIWPADIDRSTCSRDSTGHGTAELRRCSSCPQPASCDVEEVSVGRCATLEELCCTICGAREAAAGASECSQRIPVGCEEGSRVMQAGQVRSGRCATHHLRRRARGPGDYGRNASFDQNHGDNGRSCNVSPISSPRSRGNDGRRNPCSQKAKNDDTERRRSNYGWRKRIQAAFWQGWLSMTIQYANQEPLPIFNDVSSGNVAVLKWSHSVMEEHNFINEFAAIENARSLALELGSYDGIFCPATTQCAATKHPSPRRSLGFASDVDVLMGLEDELIMYQINVPETCLGAGIMPWSAGLLRGGDYSMTPQDGHDDNADSNEAAAFTPSAGSALHDEQVPYQQAPDLSQLPSWGNHIFQLWQEEGIVYDEDDGPVIMVSSFYIDHERHLLHDEPRVLRFDNEFQEWEADVRFIWEDLVDNQAPLDIVIVRPEPPHIPFRGTVATVIVHQHQRPDRAACLITAVHIMDPTTTFRHSAHSTELQLSHARTRQLAGVEEICLLRERQDAGRCTVHVGHQLQPDSQNIAVLHGLGIHIRIPSTLSIEEAEQNLCRRVQSHRQQRVGHMWDPSEHHDPPERCPEEAHPTPPTGGSNEPEDAVSFMGRRPRRPPRRLIDISSSSTSPETISSTDNGLGWRQTVIFTLDGLSTSAQLPWSDSDALFSQIAAALPIARREILRVVAVPHRPLDYVSVNLHCMMLQKSTEFRPTPFVRLILVDRELHVEQEVQTSPFRRFPLWISHVLTRTSLLEALGLGDICQAHGSLCHVWRNNILIEEHSILRFDIDDGDYIRVFVGELRDQETCLSDIDLEHPEEGEEETITEDVEDSPFFQLEMSTVTQSNLMQKPDIEPHQLRTAPNHVSAGLPLGGSNLRDQQDAGMPTPSHDFHAGDLRQLGAWFDRDALIECSDEGAIAYIDTWYIHHQRQGICRESRPFRLGNDPTQWRSEILDLWQDVIDPSLSTTIHLVQPPPPCAMTECVLAHLILEQSMRPQHGVGLITIHTRTSHGDSTRHGAYSLPNLMTERNVLHMAEMFIYCQARLCVVRLGALPFDPAEWVELPRAASLVVYIRPLIMPQDEDDHMELMQRSRTRWRRNQAPAEGLATSSTTRRCGAFVFNPHAPAFDPTAPNLNTMSEDIQELHQHWLRTAFSWEGESASTRVQTWFVDQHNQNFWTCISPRIVRLYEDFTQWEDQIKQTWRDQIDPTAPHAIQVVTPRPINTHRETAAHVILIQRPHDALATALVTVVEMNQARGSVTMQMAITTHEHMYVEHLYMALGLAGRCLVPGAPMTCQTWYDGYLIQPGMVFAARDGHGLLIRMQRRPVFQDVRDGTYLLQTRMTVIRRERQTHGQVAHTHGPRTESLFPSQCSEADFQEDQEMSQATTCIVYVHWPPNFRPSTQIPQFVEVDKPGSPVQVQQELRSMGYEGEVIACGQHDAVYFHPCIFHQEKMHIYCNQDLEVQNGIHVCRGTPSADDLIHMKFLYQKGFQKAVIMSCEQVTDYVTLLHFRNVEPKQELDPKPLRTPTAWPSPQPLQINMTKPFQDIDKERPRAAHVLEFDCRELQAFFQAPPLQLITDITPYEVPDFIKTAIQQCQTLSRHDRLVIYADGSSQSKRRHCSPLWTDMHDVSDSWCFAVFAEQYPDPGEDMACKLEFIGLTCQQVLYEQDRPHHVGTNHIGSDAAETEALLWSALWRLAQNHRIPTVFVTDSLLVGGQAAGTMGISNPNMPFYHLRAALQALEAILPGDHLRIAHTRSHAGEPYNELVDHFAKLEGRSSQYLPRQSINFQTFGSILRILWIILTQDRDLPRLCEGGLAITPPRLPEAVANLSQPVANPAVSTTSTATARTDIAISFATANVRTFYRGTDGTPGKLHYIREQFKGLNLHFLGLQETRTSACSTTAESVLRLASGDHHGQQGVELWINLQQPYGWQNKRPLFITKNGIVVTYANPRCLIARVQNAHLDFHVAVIYAPQSGIAHSEREEWWHDMMIILQEHIRDKDMVLLIDANAASGAQDGQHVFQHDDKESSGTSFLRELMDTHRLCLPATSDRHQGEQHTWTCPATQHGHRIDFVAIPTHWFPSCTTSRIIPELDLGNVGDHTAVGLEVQWYQFSSTGTMTRLRNRGYDRNAIQHHAIGQHLRDYVPLPWDTDIATQVDHCNQHLVSMMNIHCPRRKTGPKKPFITDAIWRLREQKLQAGRRLRQIRQIQAREALARVFAAWKCPDAAPSGTTFATSLLCAGFKNGVLYQHMTLALRRELRHARGTALKDAVEALPPDCHASAILHALKPLIGPTNMRHRRETPLPMVNDDDGHPCRTPGALMDRWINFFGAMEGGTRMDDETLRRMWQQNLRECIPESLCLQPEDVPTLVDLERAFRRVRPGKAIGADNVPPELCHSQPTVLARFTYTQMLKLVAHGQEALLHKGGLLVSAWKKKGAQNECSSYRSLLISSHVGKTLHRTIREQQSSIYENFLQRSQIGGRKKVPVGLGVHHVRATLRRAQEHQLSTGLIFLDLQEAFYRVIRPLAVGGTLHDEALGKIAARLKLDDQALHDLHAMMQCPPATELAGLPPHLHNALRALHTDTHFWVAGQADYVRTAVGTRPGDAFADVVFGYLFARLLKSVEEQMVEADLIEAFEDNENTGLFSDETVPARSIPYLGPTWMDDLCITVTAQTAQAIETKTGVACSILLDACQRHGVTPNLNKGKTEILFKFRGRGSRAMRTKYFGPSSSGLMSILTEDGGKEIVVVGQYQHLGGLIHHSGETRNEMRRKIAQGHQAFTQHRKILYQNDRLPLKKRSELFQTLVASKVTYGTESWTLMDKVNKQYFHSAYMRLYRRLLKLPHDQQMHDEEVSTRLGLPQPTTVLRVARLRYLVLLYKCEHVTPWSVLRADSQWMSLICDDLQWLWDLICSTSKLPAPRENFGPWENVLRYHRTYWKRLLQRAIKLELMHHEDQALLRRLHREAFQYLEETGPLAFRPQHHRRAPDQAHQIFGCMLCQKRFKSHGGEGAHLCKTHGVLAPIRWLYDDTSCPACLREYHTFAKLQQHLRCTATCRQLLQGQRRHHAPAPGKGSTHNEQLHKRHDGLLPPLQAQGPHDERRHPQADDGYHTQLFETLVTMCFDHQDHPDRDLFFDLRDKIMEQPMSWTMTRRTLHYIADMLTEDDAQLAQIALADWRQILYRLADYREWAFLREDSCHRAEPSDLTLAHYEDWCQELVRRPHVRLAREQVPRVQFQERVIVHAYSGRRRPGDFQWFLEAVATKKNLNLLFVVSLDLIIDKEWGDISRPATYDFWMHAIRSGYVQGVLGGPPCCTWSAARGKVDAEMKMKGRTGPRPIRSAEELWGFWSLSIKEKTQIMDGNRLLAFSLLCMVLLEQVGGAGALEHPAEPQDPESASIWKLPLMELLLQIPGFDKVTFAQGLLGAASAKSTTLLILNLPTLAVELRKHAISAVLPSGKSIGLDKEGHFKTSVLKEYPPALCSALAASFADFLHANISLAEGRHPLPGDVKGRLAQMVSHNYGTTIGPDHAG